MPVTGLSRDALPEPLRQPVALAWSEFSAKAASWVSALPPEVVDSLARVWAVSPFVAGQCLRRPELLRELIESGRLGCALRPGEYRDALRRTLAGSADDGELMARLRRFRNREMVRIAWRDIAGWASLEETLEALSLLAESVVEESLAVLFQRSCAVHGTPLDRHGQPQSLVVLGMGKLGAWELNFSSDIDLIFAYREDGVLPGKKGLHYAEFYTRLAQNLIKVLEAITEDGFVFRVDTRLRPFGESGPLVLSFAALEAYYQGQAREWERYAMVKARTIAGDFAAGRELEEFLRPFVYRRYLDYRALGELRALKRKIAQELRRKDRQDNIKLGPGGIREIEFIVQAFQLIRGGREKRLRQRRLQAVLTALGELELLPDPVVARLRSAYRQLRTVENRLQQYGDRQTHDLPVDPRARAALAYALGHPDWDNFRAALDEIRAAVHEVFEQVIAAPEAQDRIALALTDPPEQLGSSLRALGWEPPEPALVALERLRQTPAIRRLSARAVAELERLLPSLMRAAAAETEPAATLERLLEVITAVAGRSVYLSLLAENPPALAQLVKLTATSPWIAHTIARHPLLLDELVDPRSLYRPLDRDQLARELTRKLEAVDPGDPEQLLIALRQFKQAAVLRVAAADLAGAIPVMVVSDHLTAIAELLIAESLRLAWRQTAARHGVPPAASPDRPDGFAVIAYGKLGGIELGYGSDLDLVFLYEGDDLAPTSGDRPVTTAEFYARLAKRVIHWLTTNSPAGVLYDVDLRLRPSGNAGLLVSSLPAYETYQMQSAWTWEQQALVKARWVAGDPGVGARFQGIRERSLRRRREIGRLRQEIRDMREKMRASLSGKDPARFDLKRDEGGIVDIEFLVQFGILSRASDHEALARWTDVVRQLDALTAAGFLSADAAALLRRAYCTFREAAHRAALREQPAVVPAGQYAELRAEVQALWREFMER
ncbi:bifunctional [glutamate--ammonia ligase]-adenylyl-L-tyrosine phosphorylase/[glutamate--ammonia-ligase] adenylyltransferase [Candidatus Methylocalor cossyra]|uniref:Bifunctional glutamine synthetase adenylyltransferase/adenylyl-removing enzyme n=1 Tax=Candidatus Methylocalor cossyra TaxID=3108543 RepID=A0ABM9NG13_9GAMM